MEAHKQRLSSMSNQQKTANPTGADKKPALRVAFDSRLRLEFHGSKPAPGKNRGRTGKMICKFMKKAENHENHPRRSWALNHMGNVSQGVESLPFFICARHCCLSTAARAAGETAPCRKERKGRFCISIWNSHYFCALYP